MSRHEGVSCDSCLKGNFRGKRFKCLVCYDYDLCAVCFESGATTTRHTTEHPMQCILTRSDFDLYYSGEALTSEQPQAFTCPYCGKMGHTEASLQEHVAADHAETAREVICPICASFPGGEANQITDDFAGHLTLEHRSGPRDLISFLDEPATSRSGVRRMPHASRGVAGPRTRRSNMHFSSSGGLSPSSRETVDPITELLSQLSGVRSPAVPASTSSTLQQLQMQLQLERQQVRAARQQVERLPRRPTQSASSGCNSITLAAPPLQDTPTQPHASQSQFLLSRCMEEIMSDSELQVWEQERADRSLFVQELFLSTLAGIEALSAPGVDPLNLSGSRAEQGNVGNNLSSISEEIGNTSGVQASSNSESSRQNVLQQGEENSQACSQQIQTSNFAVAKSSATSSKPVTRQSPSTQSTAGRTQSSHQGSTSGSHSEVRGVAPLRGILAPQQQVPHLPGIVSSLGRANSRKPSEADEWRDLQLRFEKEGLDHNTLKTEEKLLHVWRWLVDAESNLRSLRKMIDKLREQQHEDLEEMESYVGQIKELAEKRADHLETETMCLRSRLESSQHQTATLATLLERSGLEGIADASLGEQVAFLIADRAKLMEEIAVLNRLNGLNGVSKEADLIAEIIKVSSEKEVLKHEAAEFKERVSHLEKLEKQLELDNERLAFKLSEALAELEERESQLKEIVTDEGRSSGMQTSMSMIWPRRESPSPPPGRRRQSAGDTLDAPRRSSPIRVGMTKKRSETLKAFPKTWNADSPPEIKVSGNQDDSDDLLDNTGSLPRSFSLMEREMLRSQSYGADSTPPSLMLSEGASERMQVKLDAQIQASRTELARLEEIKRLQSDADNLKTQLNGVIEKYNALVVRHVQHKARRKAQISDLKARLQLEAGALEVQIQSLQSQLTNQKLVLRGEEGLRKKIENDYRKSLNEKRSLLVSMMSLENCIRDRDREVSVLQKKVTMLENANKDLLVRLLQVKYSHPCRSRSLTRVEGVLTDLGSV